MKEGKERYNRNLGAVTEEEQALLGEKSVLLVGCGGLGGYILMCLARLGVGRITVVDEDVFEESNRNRQLFALKSTLGKGKAETAAEAIREVNEEVEVSWKKERFTRENGCRLAQGHDLLIDGVDNIKTRRAMAAVCRELEIPMVYGAVRGWNLQVSVLRPETAEKKLQMLYPREEMKEDKASLSFVVSACAAIESGEAAKALLGKADTLEGQLLFGDLLHQEWERIPL